MPQDNPIVLGDGLRIPVLYEDRSVLAIDKPSGWMLAPERWVHTSRNLQLALESSIRSREYWAKSRQINFLRYVHRLDADTSGVLLLAKSVGALPAYSQLFREGQVRKTYLAVTRCIPAKREWIARQKLTSNLSSSGKIQVDARHGKEAETHFRIIETHSNCALIEAEPVTGRTHQIRVHLAASGCPILGDRLYGQESAGAHQSFGLRAVVLIYKDPFRRRTVQIQASAARFLETFRFAPSAWPEQSRANPVPGSQSEFS